MFPEEDGLIQQSCARSKPGGVTFSHTDASLVKRGAVARRRSRLAFPASHLQDAVSDEEQARELSWERERERG